MNSYKFLRIYRDIAKGAVNPDDLTILYWDLKYAFNDDVKLGSFFSKSEPSKLEMALAIDAVAHDIHQEGNDTLQKAFPGSSYDIVKENLDELAGLEKTSEVRKANRDYFTPLLATHGMIFLEKQQIGMTTKEDIVDAIKEYERLHDAEIASPAEILTLFRYYGPGSKYEKVVSEKGLDDEENEPLVVGGPASVETVDREGHLITSKALAKAFGNFMKNFRTRNCQVFHSDVQAGWALPAYITKTGQIFKSGVDEQGLWLISEIRNDTRVAQRMAEEIQKGNIRSYSIAGSATNTEFVTKGSQNFMQVNDLELAEVTFCVTPSTKVWVSDEGKEIPRLKQIKNIAVDDFVLTHTMEFHRVTDVFEREIKEDIIRITNDHGARIEITKEHPVMILGLGFEYEWIKAGDLKRGNTVKILNTHHDISYSTIKVIETMHYEGKVYNIEVEKDNSYVTEAMAIHNCEKGVNQGAHFDILKSATKTVINDVEDILKNVPTFLTLPEYNAFIDNSQVVIKTDVENSITDALRLELRKYVPENVDIVVSDNISSGAIPLFKMEGTKGYYYQLIHNYPEFDNIPFQRYVSEETGKNPKDFGEIPRGRIERISQQWLKDKRAIKPEFSTAYVQKQKALEDVAPQLAENIEGKVFKQSQPTTNPIHSLKIYRDANYKPADVENEECHVCIFFSEGYCTKLHLPVEEEYTCDYYKSMPGAEEAEEWAETMILPFEEKEYDRSKIEKLKHWVKENQK